MTAKRMTIPDAIRELFGIDVAKESPLLKNKANSLVRNGLVGVETEQIVQRKSVYLAPGQEVVLFNALVLNAVFPDPKDVKKIFQDPRFRRDAALIIEAVLSGAQSLVGVGLCHPDCQALIECIKGDFDLFAQQLPNPFRVLPQVALGGEVTLLQALLAQASSLSSADSFLLYFLNGDLEEAFHQVQRVDTDRPELLALKAMVESRFREAQEFDALLDQFRLM